MLFEWDGKKAAKNRTKHGISFEACEDFAWHKAVIFSDTRHDYREERSVAIGPIDERLYVIVYVRRGERTRIISLRKANERERRIYEEETTD